MNNENLQSFDKLTVQIFDKNGVPKRIFQENAIFLWLIKHKIVSSKFPKIPFLLGRWSDTKILKIHG